MRGYSAANFNAKDSKGNEYTIFMVDILHMMKTKTIKMF